MCGIGGVVYLDGRGAPPGVLTTMASLLRHRGPDGQDTRVSGSVGLAHSRLAILDPSERGRQPMSYGEGRYWITYNGEIYNFLEIREQLEKKKYAFATETDTEVILAAFSEWGDGAVERFNGMFAFALWDEEEKVLRLYRDRFGVKPLYYFFDGKVFAFASEMKGFLAVPDIELGYDGPGLTTLLAYGRESEGLETTPFASVRKLLPGSGLTLSLDKKEPRVHRWWRLIDALPEVSAVPKKQTERLYELMFDACRVRMRSDVPIGTCLSGGLDSSTVFAVLNEIGRSGAGQARIPTDWQTAFIMRLAGADNEEQRLAEEFARSLEANVKILDDSLAGDATDAARADETFETLRRMTYDFEGIGFIFPAQWKLYKEVRANGIRVTLDGHGADESLAGYPHYAETSALDSLHSFGTAANALDGIRADQRAWEDYARSVDLAPNMHRFQVPEFDPAWVARNHAATFCDGEPPPLAPPHWDADKDDLAGTENLFRVMYFMATCGFLQWILRTYDHASMAHGVENRAPFLDPALFAFAFSLPARRKIRNGCGKFILREAMAGLVPDGIRNRGRKIGLNVPLGEWLSGPLLAHVRAVLGSPAFADGHPWDGAKVSAFVDGEDMPMERKMDVVWPLIQGHMLAETFREKRLALASAT